ncbi:hypothetical protein QCA50_004265 [Cerrena zonata]|uniref:Uncharacterized protein n=1 Tax=Cerrena zonata TaxID=2478898 RepID=A0AAW0GIZ2_9APHY
MVDEPTSPMAGPSSEPIAIPIPSPRPSVATVPLPRESRRTRSQGASDFPPPMRRVSMDMTGVSRPVSFSAKFSRVHPATTGVTVLEHMERLDAVEAGLKRLGIEEAAIEDEEMDVGESSQSNRSRRESDVNGPPTADLVPEPSSAPLLPAHSSLLTPPPILQRLPSVPEDDDQQSIAEEDLVAMSKSMSHIESGHGLHTRFASISGSERNNLDWMQTDNLESPKKRLVIAERLETVNVKPLFDCW